MAKMTPAQSRERALNAALAIARGTGYVNVAGKAVADAIGVSRVYVWKLFGDREKLQQAVIRYAIEQRDLDVIGQALANNEPTVADVKGTDLGKQAIARLMG